MSSGLQAWTHNVKRGTVINTDRQIHILNDLDQVSRYSAERFVALAVQSIAERGTFTVALSGGSTPRHLFRALTQDDMRARVDWSNVEFFWGDERCVEPDHPDSNYRMAHEALLKPLNVPRNRIHRIEAERDDRHTAAFEYQMTLARVCGSGADAAPPALDLVLLGMGADGHTASLFPSTTALSETEKWVVPNYVPPFDAFRMTMTAAMINAASHIVFLVVGEDKAPRLAEVLEGPRDPQKLPAQLIHSIHGQTEWIVDQAAASKLRRDVANSV